MDDSQMSYAKLKKPVSKRLHAYVILFIIYDSLEKTKL